MKALKRVLVPVVCVLVLASAAFADMTRMTKAELHDFVLKNFRPAAGATLTPEAYLKWVRALKVPKAPVGIPTKVTADKAYGASRIVSEPFEPLGLGVGELGDYAIINDADYGEMWNYKNGDLKYVMSSPGDYLAAGRMYGRYYFGDLAGNIFRLEHDGKITTIFDGIDEDGIVVGSMDIDPETGLLAFAVDVIGGPAPAYAPGQPPFGSLLIIVNPANLDDYLVDYFGDYCFGVAFKGNFLYASLVYNSVIIKFGRYGGGPYLFTDNLEGPADIQIDPKGNVYVAEMGTGNILKFNPTATSRKRIAWGFYEPFCLGLDRKGDVFVSDPYMGEVWKLRKR